MMSSGDGTSLTFPAKIGDGHRSEESAKISNVTIDPTLRGVDLEALNCSTSLFPENSLYTVAHCMVCLGEYDRLLSPDVIRNIRNLRDKIRKISR